MTMTSWVLDDIVNKYKALANFFYAKSALPQQKSPQNKVNIVSVLSNK